MDGARFFATEDIDFILGSPSTLGDNDTIVLEWDRNSMEAPFLGPNIDSALCSALFVHRLGDDIRLEGESDAGRKAFFTITLRDWLRAVKELDALPQNQA